MKLNWNEDRTATAHGFTFKIMQKRSFDFPYELWVQWGNKCMLSDEGEEIEDLKQVAESFSDHINELIQTTAMDVERSISKKLIEK